LRNLPTPSRDTVEEDLKNALKKYKYRREEKGYQASEEEIVALMAIYNSYDQSAGAPSAAHAGPNLGSEIKDALYSAYDLLKKGRRLHHVRRDLLREVGRCPICGITIARKLDHFLPRSAFKTLAIYSRNLVPVCGDCNEMKSDKGVDLESERFVHAYFDVLPDIDFIVAEVTLEGAALSFEFTVAEQGLLGPALAEKLVYQLGALSLNERFSAELNTYLSSLSTSLRMIWEYGGAPDIRVLLAKQIVGETREHHRNDWRVVTLKALLKHDGFCGGGFQEVFALSERLRDPAVELVTA